ncbi:MAG: protein kinase [Candidatus Hadarchaeum sp.]
MSEDLVGRILGKYELRERIGRGGMAEVYKAYHASLDRYVALKILHPFLSEDPEFKERFEREARNVAQLRHPNIVQVYDFDVDPNSDLYYMVMEYIDGPTLRARLMQLSFQGEQVPIPEAIRITRDLASALAYAHSRDMIHRDIKPGNIMLDSDGRVVLTDFGIARIVSGPNMTASGSMVGTPAYMSPEQGLGQSGDHRSDIYSLGVVLYQLVTGTIPFDADTPIAIVLKHVNDPLPPPSGINPNVPEGLERILYKALAKSPDDRYQNIEEMIKHLNDLDTAAAAIPPPGEIGVSVPNLEVVSTPVPVSTPTASSVRRSGCLIGFVLMLIALASMLAGFYLAFTGILSNTIAFVPDVAPILTNTPEPSDLPPPSPTPSPTPFTPTPDVQSTNIALTVEALASQVAAPTFTPIGLDLTATVMACDYDYEIVSQSPENGAFYRELTTLTKRIVIINDSKCPLDDDIRLVFADGYRLEGPDFVEFNRQLEPGEEFEIVLNLRTPRYDPANPVVISTWILVLPDGLQVGPPLTFELTIFQ